MKRILSVCVSIILVIALVACAEEQVHDDLPIVLNPSSTVGPSSTTPPTTQPTTESSDLPPSEPYLVFSPYVVSTSVREYLGEDYGLYCDMVDSLINYDGRVSGFKSEQHFRKVWGIMLEHFYPAQKICAHYGSTNKPFTYEDGVVQLGMQLEREEHDRTIQVFADRITKDLSCVDKDDSEVEVIAKLYMHVSTQLQYEMKYSDMYDVIMNNKGICGSYSSYFMLLLSHAGIECHRAGSFGAGVDHAWVIAKMEGQYYHFDPTSENISRNWYWFALGDVPQHEAVTRTSPDCLELMGDWDYETGTWMPPYTCPETFCEETRNSTNPPWLW